MFQNNNLPMTYEQELLRNDFQAWLAKLYRLNQSTISFLTVCDRFPKANYADLMAVYNDFHVFGFLEEVSNVSPYHDKHNSCVLSDDGEELGL